MALGSIPMPWGAGLTLSAIGLSFAHRSRTPLAYSSGTPVAYCLGTPSPPSDCPSACMLHGGALVLGGGATGTLSSSDHLDIAALCV